MQNPLFWKSDQFSSRQWLPLRKWLAETCFCSQLQLLMWIQWSIDPPATQSDPPSSNYQYPPKKLKLFQGSISVSRPEKKIKNSLNKLFSFNRVPGKQNQFLLKTKQAIWIRESPNKKEKTTWSSFFLFKTKQEKLDPSKRGQGTQFKAQQNLQRIKNQ